AATPLAGPRALLALAGPRALLALAAPRRAPLRCRRGAAADVARRVRAGVRAARARAARGGLEGAPELALPRGDDVRVFGQRLGAGRTQPVHAPADPLEPAVHVAAQHRGGLAAARHLGDAPRRRVAELLQHPCAAQRLLAVRRHELAPRAAADVVVAASLLELVQE